MYPFILPDYKGGSIINLMSSISRSYGQKHSYPQCKILSPSALEPYKNIILLIIDGLGLNYLKTKKDSFLLSRLKAPLTSTFLSTTACANTAFSTGYPAQQHALTGWDINMKEIGAVTTILPFRAMYGSENLAPTGFSMEDLIGIPSFHKGLKADSFTLIAKKLSDSPFTRYVSRNTEIIGTVTYKNAFTRLKALCKKNSARRRFFHVYLPELDAAAHSQGIESRGPGRIFADMDRRISSLSRSLEGTGTLILVTADHGFIDTSRKSELWTHDIPGFDDCLTTALAGESRARNIYIRPGRVKTFEEIVKKKLSKYAWCYKGEKLIADGLYGLGKPSPHLYHRVGDYVLVMKENYVLMHRLANFNEKKPFLKGKHGGVSEDEMLVPLCICDCR